MNGQLSDLARAELETLAAEGIVPSWDDVAELNALGWQVETPETRRELARGSPVSVGGVTLRPLTLAGWAWFERVGEQCRDQNAALAYAMAHGANVCRERSGWRLLFDLLRGKAGESELDCATPIDVWEWRRKIRATERELVLAVAEVIDQDRGPELPPRKDSPGLADLSAVIVAAVGGDPDTWERQVRIGYVGEVMAAVARSQGTGDGKPDPNDPRIQAQAAIIWAVKKIRQRHAAAVENAAAGTGGGSNGG